MVTVSGQLQIGFSPKEQPPVVFEGKPIFQLIGPTTMSRVQVETWQGFTRRGKSYSTNRVSSVVAWISERNVTMYSPTMLLSEELFIVKSFVASLWIANAGRLNMVTFSSYPQAGVCLKAQLPYVRVGSVRLYTISVTFRLSVQSVTEQPVTWILKVYSTDIVVKVDSDASSGT